MKQRLVAAAFLLTLGGCFQAPSESYSPVGQAALTAVGVNEDAAAARVEAIVLAKGLKKEPGIPLAKIGGPPKERWYQDAHGTYASIAVSTHGCVSFLTYVRAGSNDRAAAQQLWHDVIGRIGQDSSWTIERDQVCEPAT